MFEWWNELTVAFQVFYSVGILATVVLVIQLILSLFGFGEDGQGVDAGGVDAADGIDAAHGFDATQGMDAAADAAAAHDAIDTGDVAEHASGLRVVSVRTVIAFMAGFGWTGVVALQQGLGLPVAVVLATAVGAVLMWLVFLLMKTLYGLRESGTLDYRNAIGDTGTVYVAIPPGRGGEGQVQMIVQGRLTTIPACTEASRAIPSGTQVRVTELAAPRLLLVESLRKESATPADKNREE